MTQFTSATIEIEFTAGAWTDVSPYYRPPIRLRLGRPTMFDDVGAGVLKVRLDNFDGRFMPDSMASPYWPNVVKSRRIRLKVTKAGTTWTRHVGWIQAWEPHFPSGSTSDAYVEITSVDALGLLAQRKLRSNWTEQLLKRARDLSVEGDAWEPIGQVNGLYAYMQNFTENGGHPGPIATNFIDAPPLSFGSDELTSIGMVARVSSDSSRHSCSTGAQFPTGNKSIQFLYKAPNQHVPDITIPFTFATLYEGSRSRVGNLVLYDNAGVNGFSVYNGANTSSLGFVHNLDGGVWYLINIDQNPVNLNRSDFGAVRVVDGTVGALLNVDINVQNINGIDVPGYQGQTMDGSYGGIVALKDSGLQDYLHSIKTGNTSVAERMTSLASACGRLPVSFTQLGDWSALACTGDWSGRSALDVAAEIARTTRSTTTGTGLMFARPKDSQVLAISGNLTRPVTPIATVSCDMELLEGIDMLSAVESSPTRITVSSPQTTITVVDDAAEAAGEYRAVTVDTLSRQGYSDAADIGALYLAKNKGLRFGKIRIDLTAATNDVTAALFDESGANTGMFPTAKLRVTDLPPAFFTYPTRDTFIEGWDEIYDARGCSIEADCSAAASQTIASDLFTGSNGAGWAAQWVTGGNGTGQSVTIQTNRGRISPGTVSGAYTSRRLNVTARVDGELTGSMILNNSASTGYAWLRGSSDLFTDGYSLRMSTSGQIVIERKVSGASTVIATFARTLVAGTQYGWRIRGVGKWINARVWTWGFAEQGTWDLAVTDTAITAAGYAGLAALNDATTTSKTVDFDDLVYTDAAGT